MSWFDTDHVIMFAWTVVNNGRGRAISWSQC